MMEETTAFSVRLCSPRSECLIYTLFEKSNTNQDEIEEHDCEQLTTDLIPKQTFYPYHSTSLIVMNRDKMNARRMVPKTKHPAKM